MIKRTQIDPWIIAPIIVLLLFSFTILRSVLPSEAGRHLLFSIAGISAFFFVSQIDYRTYIPLSKLFYILSILFLVLTFIFGEATRGSIRWIRIGSLTLQTSELIKPLMIISLAIFARKLNLGKISHLTFYITLALLPVFIVFLQPDLGSAMVLSVIGISIAIAKGVRLKIFVILFILASLLSPLLYKNLKPYQQERLNAYINPFSDPLGSGYSVIQSMIAIGSGKLVGRGLGHGTQSQLQFLPERHSDFIFASLAEELGFIGSILILVSYFVLLARLLQIARDAEDETGSLIITGVFLMLLFQIGVNIGMNVGILPITGITLPLISSGGSSMLSIMISLGLVHSVSLRKKPAKTIEIH